MEEIINEYQDLTHKEVLLLQEELGKLPGVANNWVFGCTVLMLGIVILSLNQLGIVAGQPSALLFFILVFCGFVFWGLRMNYQQRKLLKKDLAHRQKVARRLYVERKERSYGNKNYRVFPTNLEDPVFVTPELFKQIEIGDELIIWESAYAKIELAKELRSNDDAKN